MHLSTKSVQSTSLAFQCIDNIHGCHRLPLCMLGVGDGITDDVLKEHLQDTTGLLVDESGDTLDTTTTCKTTDCWLGDTLDIITQDFPVTLCATLSQALSSLASARHLCVYVCVLATKDVNKNKTAL